MRHFLSMLIVALGAATPVLTSATTNAADYEIVASGPYFSGFVDSSTFDGTTSSALPPMLDLARLEGGSFRATYRFNEVTPNAGVSAYYLLSPSSGITSFELLDASGAVVHAGSGPTLAEALVQNNYGGAPYTVDSILLGSSGQTVTGANVPSPLYSQPSHLMTFAGFNFGEYVGNGGPEYLNDLSIPTDAATYLAFPEFKVFDMGVEFGDGDWMDRVNPYQYAYAQLQYDITALTVTPIPEPAAACVLLSALCLLRRRRRSVVINLESDLSR